MTWVVYDPATTDVLRLDNSETEPVGESFVFIEQTIVSWPAVPAGHAFRVVNSAPAVVDLRDLALRKAERRAEINAMRDALEVSPVTWDGDAFDADRDSLLRIFGAMSMITAGMFTAQEWTLADKAVRTMSGPDIVALMATIGQRTGALHATARTLKAQIDAATTSAELAAIAWPQGS